jgi:signal transduction histidine kinase
LITYGQGMFRRWARYRDVGFAVLLAGLGEAELLSGEQYNHQPVWPGPKWLNVFVILAMTAPMAWRRSRPLASATTIFVVGTATSLTLGAPEATTTFVLLIATTFAGSAYSRRWWIVVAGAGVLCLAHAVNDPSSEGLPDLFWVFGLAGIAVLLGRAQYARQHRIGALEDDARQAAFRHARQVAAATAAERAAIAREIHDLVSHAVSVIVIQAQAGSRALPRDPAVATEALDNIEASARTAMSELRRLLILLDDGDPAVTTPASSMALLPELIDRCRAAGMHLDVDLPEVWYPVSPSADAAAFHAVREALTNAMRYAPGGRVRLAVSTDGGGLEISVTDTGPAPGGVAIDHRLGAGRGLIGMRERVLLLGGQLDAGPHDGGFRVHARLPLDRDPLDEGVPTAVAAATVT